ncbi:hypothetical protein JOF56_003756 [Kibdelosporangium banguiense]|uniref:HNH endonuclease n=1 Tax=Kibdelosporangium banguiense TaxID=1365924 RepID=A0ABS4TG15_9PSEU|nr:hypothetical protein [Kibdelosporangium banguiense]
MRTPPNTLRALQRAGYKCQTRTSEGYQCNAPAGHVDRSTGLVVCQGHKGGTASI